MLPEVSVAVQVTVVVPGGNIEPDGGTQTTDCTAQLSVAVGVVKLAPLLVVMGHDADPTVLMFAGQVIDGGCVSLTVTVKLHIAVRPDEPVAEQVTVVTPTGNVCGDVMTIPPAVHVGVIAPPHGSVALTEKLTEAEHWFGSLLTMMFPGQLTVGGTPPANS